MVSRAPIAAAVLLGMTSAAAGEPSRVVIVDISGSSESANAVDEIRARLDDKTQTAASEPDIRGALEGPSAAGGGELDEATSALASAQSKFADFAIAGAISELGRAKSAAVAALASRGPAARAVLADVHFLWGRVLEADGSSSAIEHFRTTVRLDPDRKAIDPGQFKPSLVKLYRRAAATANASASGALVLSGRPAGARVEIDGRAVGELPFSDSQLPLGTHYVVVSAPSFKPQPYVVSLQTKTVRHAVELEPMSRSEKLTQVRDRMMQSSTPAEDDLEALAIAATAATVIVVRERKGRIEASAFERGGKLGPWAAPGALTFRAVASVKAPPGKPTDAPLVTALVPAEPAPWYLTWKGAAVGAAVIGAVTAAILLSRGDTEFEVGGVCTGAQC